jgi:hypothetical protein
MRVCTRLHKLARTLTVESGTFASVQTYGQACEGACKLAQVLVRQGYRKPKSRTYFKIRYLCGDDHVFPRASAPTFTTWHALSWWSPEHLQASRPMGERVKTLASSPKRL